MTGSGLQAVRDQVAGRLSPPPFPVNVYPDGLTELPEDWTFVPNVTRRRRIASFC